MEYVYNCKKNGRDYAFTGPDGLSPQDAYAWRRGVREYMDNYHAAVTRAGLVKGKTIKPWTNTVTFEDTVTTYCEDAVARFNAGDVPGTRARADSKLATAKKLAATLEALGVDPALLTAVNPENLAAWLARQEAQGRTA